MTDEVTYAAAGGIAEITLARGPVNALSVDFLEAILDGFRRAAADDAVRAVILRSALPRSFSAGLDLDILMGKGGLEVRRFLERLYVGLADVQFGMGKPTIAAVNGAARGGGMTLAISCDVILAAEEASFGYPEIELGLIPAIHFAHLPRIVGRHRAFELLFTGRRFEAAEAASIGLVSRVVPDDALDAAARALAADFAAKPPIAMRLGRAAFMRANDLDYRRSVANAVEDFCNLATTPEAQEGLTAFLEKREPSWRG
ncbi:enoyl-CoA hydratase/isomerase family protein [Roseomonas sp. SSH11]|uniref:Enoyl-CoA hydratase/isomerase family protein n=1 Tax=Pararoseomonas baculiformis TaxID=2820812 RepID=A0ABS4AJJ5_9PROT|nr:enoyl-CoA hydratase/isomerase family protein [Pararoseomonas baculiformis]MBP0447208.1 enoyl-CoA hydratase/isomerase family protein [Pararoseomonas baculiformis]